MSWVNGNMKLIDGEWLSCELFKHHVHDDDDLEPMVYLSDANRLIDTAPVVEAIPIGWIRAIRDMMNSGIVKSYGYGLFLDNLIRMWEEDYGRSDMEEQCD